MGIEPFLIFLVVALYGLIHSLLASLWAKSRARQWIGPPADRWYRLAYNLFGFISLPVLLARPPAGCPAAAISFLEYLALADSYWQSWH
jgi:hypothetical protein